nr:hypothetical protein [Gemmatimonadaceae bacterium]
MTYCSKRRRASHRQLAVVGALWIVACAAPVSTTPAPRDDAQAAARAAIAAERAGQHVALSERTIGVPALRFAAADTSLSALAYGLAEQLATDLGRSARITVVERLRLAALMDELKLADTGGVDPSTAARVGRLVAARRLVTGTLRNAPSDELEIGAEIVDVETGEIRRAVAAHAPLDRIFDAETALAFQIFDALGITLSPAERAAVEARPTKSVTAFLAFSRGVRDEAFGRY